MGSSLTKRSQSSPDYTFLGYLHCIWFGFQIMVKMRRKSVFGDFCFLPQRSKVPIYLCLNVSRLVTLSLQSWWESWCRPCMLQWLKHCYCHCQCQQRHYHHRQHHYHHLFHYQWHNHNRQSKLWSRRSMTRIRTRTRTSSDLPIVVSEHFIPTGRAFQLGLQVKPGIWKEHSQQI